VNAGIAKAAEIVERRAEDLRMLFTGGAQPNFADALRLEHVEPTDNPLSVALPPDAFFVAGDAAKPSYTRDGALEVRDGVLVSSDGTPVLGFVEGDSSNVPRALSIEKNDALLGRASDIRVEPDGVFGYARSVIEPGTGESQVERVAVGRVALARFPAATRLERLDTTHVRAPAHVVPLIGRPNDGSFLSLETQRRALGHLDSDVAVSRLQDAYLAMRALSAAERSRNAFARGAFDLVK
jgi:flagellar basal body rod protein FlgG